MPATCMDAFCYSSGLPGTCSSYRLHMSCITTVHCTHTLKLLPVVLQAILRAVVHNLFTLAHTLIKFTHTYTHIMLTHIPVSSLTAHTSSSTDMLIILKTWNARSFPPDSAPVLRSCTPVVMWVSESFNTWTRTEGSRSEQEKETGGRIVQEGNTHWFSGCFFGGLHICDLLHSGFRLHLHNPTPYLVSPLGSITAGFN